MDLLANETYNRMLVKFNQKLEKLNVLIEQVKGFSIAQDTLLYFGIISDEQRDKNITEANLIMTDLRDQKTFMLTSIEDTEKLLTK